MSVWYSRTATPSPALKSSTSLSCTCQPAARRRLFDPVSGDLLRGLVDVLRHALALKHALPPSRRAGFGLAAVATAKVGGLPQRLETQVSSSALRSRAALDFGPACRMQSAMAWRLQAQQAPRSIRLLVRSRGRTASTSRPLPVARTNLIAAPRSKGPRSRRPCFETRSCFGSAREAHGKRRQPRETRPGRDRRAALRAGACLP